jgi:hypothetical protein
MRDKVEVANRTPDPLRDMATVPRVQCSKGKTDEHPTNSLSVQPNNIKNKQSELRIAVQ